jgi:hypothetical protein
MAAMAFGLLVIPVWLGGRLHRLFSSPIQCATRLDQKCSRPLMAWIVVGAFMPNDELRKSGDIDWRFE